MAKTVYSLPNGEQFEVDSDSPEAMAWVQQNKATPVQERSLTEQVAGMGMAAGSGLVKGLAKTPFLMSDLLNLGLDVTKNKLNPEWMNSEGYKDFRKYHKGSGWVDEALAAGGGEFYKPQGTAEKLVDAGAGGAGAGALGSMVRMAAPAARMLPGLSAPAQSSELIRSTARAGMTPSAAAGALGGTIGEGTSLATDSPMMGLAAGLVSGTAAGGMLGRTDKAKAALALAGQAHTPADFAQAGRNLDLTQRMGAKTATLGEMFPDRSPFLKIVNEAGDQAGTNPVIRGLAGRQADNQQLIDKALSSLGPRPAGQRVANEAAEAAKTRLGQMDAAASDVYSRRLAQMPPLDKQEVKGLVTQLREMARSEQSHARRNALNEAANALMTTEPKKFAVREKNGNWRIEERDVPTPKTDVQAIKDDLSALQKKPTFDPTKQGPASLLDAKALQDAYRMVMDSIKAMGPEYPQGLAGAERGFSRVKQATSNPARQGPLKTLAGAESDINSPAAVVRLNSLIEGQDAQGVSTLLNSLQKGSPNPELKQEIARVLLGRRVETGLGNSAEKLLGGAPGSASAETTEALLKAAGQNTKAFLEPVEAARLLSRVGGEAAGGSAQRGKQMGSNWFTSLINPGYDITLRSGLAARQKGYSEIAEMLKPTPENLARLQELAKKDPNLLLRLGLGGGLLGGTTAAEGR